MRKLQFCQTKWLRICLTLLFNSLTQNFIKMKRTLIFFVIATAIFAASCKKESSTPKVVISTDSIARADSILHAIKLDSLTPGAGYANDVYYSFANGVVASVSR